MSQKITTKILAEISMERESTKVDLEKYRAFELMSEQLKQNTLTPESENMLYQMQIDLKYNLEAKCVKILDISNSVEDEPE